MGLQNSSPMSEVSAEHSLYSSSEDYADQCTVNHGSSDLDHGLMNSGSASLDETTSPSTTTPPSWETRFQELLNWRGKHGDTCVPKAEGALGRWVARQRELKRTGSKKI